MSDYIKRDDAVMVVAEYLMNEAMWESPDASDNIEDWKEIAEDIIPAAEYDGERRE